MSCLDAEAAMALLQRRLEPEAVAAIDTHVDRCSACRQFLAALARDLEPDDALQPGELLPPGARVARYVVIEMIGAGAMGVVYLAYDPELDRRVALKFLRTQPGAIDTDRLRLEGQAMAKITHPNVVQVFDVGTHRDHLFIAMEFVDGNTLSTWLANGNRSWQQIVDTFLEAGHGLHSAHLQGLVHRDFKPDNVLVSASEERVCVTDFGLVRPAVGDPDASEGAQLAGTLAYMAPEQMSHGTADARSDQFTFAVSLYEALCHRRPFTGTSRQELLKSIKVGLSSRQSQLRERLEKTTNKGDVIKIQPRLYGVLKRALDSSPSARYGSMTEFLEQLESLRRPKRQYWLMAAASVVLVGMGLFAAFPRSAAPICQGASQRLSSVWNTDVRSSIEQTTKAHGPAAVRFLEQLDAQGALWVDQHTSACQATRVHGHQSERQLELRMGCLERLLSQFDSLLTQAPKADFTAFVDAATSLEAPSVCGELAQLEQATSDHAGTTNLHAPLWQRFHSVQALVRLRQSKKAAPLTLALLSDVEAADAEALEAQVRSVWATILEDTGQIDKAKAMYEQALLQAATVHNEPLVSKLWLSLARLASAEQRRHQDARELLEVAKVAIARVSDRSKLDVQRLLELGVVSNFEGDFVSAESQIREALEASRSVNGPNHPRTQNILLNLGDVLRTMGKLTEAEAVLRKLLSIRVERYGTENLLVAGTLGQLARLDYHHGRHHEALTGFERVLALQISHLGAHSPEVASSHILMGVALRALGRSMEARKHYEKALQIRRASHGENSAPVAMVLNNLANIYYDEEQLGRARELFEESYKIKKKLGERHIDVAVASYNLGEILRAETGSCMSSRSYWLESLAIREESLDAGHADLAFPLTSLGACHLEQEQIAQARTLLERALKIRLAQGVDPVLTAKTQFALARVLWQHKGESKRARALLQSAHQSFLQASDKKLLSDLVEWNRKVGLLP